MKPGRRLFTPHADAVAPALVVAMSALVFWLPRAAALGTIVASILALAGGLAGHALSRSRLRAPVVLAAIAILAAAVTVCFGLASRVSLFGPWAEAFASALDAALIGCVSLAAAAAATFASGRFRWARPLPAVALVFAAASLFAAHRGGAIHRPRALSDPAWLHGWNPAWVLAATGAAVGLVASLSLLRPRRTRKLGWQLAGLALIFAALISFAPIAGIYIFPTVDPLGLSSDAPSDWLERRSLDGGGGDTSARDGRGDPLALGEAREGSGASDQEMVPFRDEYRQDGAEAPVAVVILHDDVEPMGGVFYFRQVAFSKWNGRRLVRSAAPGVDSDLFRRFPSIAPLRVAPPPSSSSRRRIPTTVSLMRDHAQPPVLADGVELTAARVADPSLFKRAFRARSDVIEGSPIRLLGRSSTGSGWPGEARRAYLEVPTDPRYRKLAQETLESLQPEYREDPWARAIGVSLWLEQNTRYSLRSQHASASDPTGSFLFGERVGYCVHLAHAAAYLTRALGLPSRVAAGYAYSAADRAGGSAILLRAGDAHAWAEVYLDGVGWVPVDPSPPTLDPALPAPDLDLQRLLGELARPQQNRETVQLADLPSSGTPGRLFAFALLAALLAWATSGYALKAYRRAAPWLARRDPFARLAYRASLDRLAEAGVYRSVGETREAFAARARELSPAFGRLTDDHLAARYGSVRADPGRARRLASAVAREIANRAGQRRWLGVVSPWRWTRAR